MNQAAPQTGLSVLMNGGVNNFTPNVQSAQETTYAPMSAPLSLPRLTPEARQRYQQDLVERDRQASALAAAGMVAESIYHTKSSGVGQVLQQSYTNQGLQPPPSLVLGSGSACADVNVGQTTPSIELDTINWNLMDLGSPPIDDMDMDFVAMFDPANELSHMHAHGTVWSTMPCDNAVASHQATTLGSAVSVSVPSATATGTENQPQAL
jgi:hypothetical protein